MKSPLKLVVSLAAVLAVSAPVSAQSPRPERPYRGLFGGGVGDAEQLLTFSLSLGGGYDDNIFAEEGVSSDPNISKGGGFGSLSTGLSYSFSGPRVQVGASAGASTRYRPGFSDTLDPGYSAGLGLSVPLWKGAQLSASQSASYHPYFVLDLAPSITTPSAGQVPIPSPEFAARRGDYLSYSTSLGISQRLSSRGTLSASFDQHLSEFSETDDSYLTRGGGIRYTHSIARGLGMRLGYGFREGDVSILGGTGERTRVQSIDAGLDFSRALSFSRRTSLAFATGSSAVTEESRTRYYLTGSATLRHEIGRTWSAGLGYDRSLQYIDGLGEFVLTDGAAATLAGSFNRRVQFNARAGMSFGHAGTAGSDAFDSFLATAGISYGIARNVGLGVSYSYYRYQFERAVLPAGFDQQLDRQSVHAYLSFWAPLVHRARRPDAAR